MSTPERIYIVTPLARWQSAQHAGELVTPALASEGFIHAARREQVAGVLQRHYAGQTGLLLLEVDASALGASLRYAASARSGELYPHVHAPVPLAAVRAVLAIDPQTPDA